MLEKNKINFFFILILDEKRDLIAKISTNVEEANELVSLINLFPKCNSN